MQAQAVRRDRGRRRHDPAREEELNRRSQINSRRSEIGAPIILFAVTVARHYIDRCLPLQYNVINKQRNTFAKKEDKMREISLYEMKPVFVAGEIDNLIALQGKLANDKVGCFHSFLSTAESQPPAMWVLRLKNCILETLIECLITCSAFQLGSLIPE